MFPFVTLFYLQVIFFFSKGREKGLHFSIIAYYTRLSNFVFKLLDDFYLQLSFGLCSRYLCAYIFFFTTVWVESVPNLTLHLLYQLHLALEEIKTIKS